MFKLGGSLFAQQARVEISVMMGKVAVFKKMSQKFIKSCLFEKNVAKMFGMSFYLLLIKVKEMKEITQKNRFPCQFSYWLSLRSEKPQL